MEKTYQVASPGGPSVREGKGFYIGLDLGQSRDYTALIILEKLWIRGKADSRGRAVFEHRIRRLSASRWVRLILISSGR